MAHLILLCYSQNPNLYINAAALYCNRFTVSSIALVGVEMDATAFSNLEAAFTRFRQGPQGVAPGNSDIYARLRSCTDVRFKRAKGDGLIPTLVQEFGARDAHYDLSGLTKRQFLNCAVDLVAQECSYIYTTSTAHPRQDLLHEMPAGEMGIDDLSDISGAYYTFIQRREGKGIFWVTVVSLLASILFFALEIFSKRVQFFDAFTSALELFAALVAAAIGLVIGLESFRRWRKPSSR